jgi:hypothetical protein
LTRRHSLVRPGFVNWASFASAVETAVLLGVITLSAEGRQLSRVSGPWQLGLLWLGVAFLVVALLLVLWVVSPHLRTKRVGDEYRSNVIYFGHARYWQPGELTSFLSGADILPMPRSGSCPRPDRSRSPTATPERHHP